MNQEQKLRAEKLLDEAYEIRVKDLEKSTGLTYEALELSRAIESEPLIAKGLSYLALFAMIRGQHQQSLDYSNEAIKYFEKLDDELGVAGAMYSIAGIYYRTNNYHLGMLYLIDCLKIYRKHEDWYNESKTQKSLGAIYEFLGDQVSAIKAYELAIKAAIKVKNKNLESNAYNPLSGILIKVGEVDKALEMIERSVVLKEETGDYRGSAFSLYGRGKVYMHLGRLEEAEVDFLEALRIHQSVNEKFGIGMAYNKIASLRLKMGQVNEAKEVLHKAIELSSKHKITFIYSKCNFSLYKIYKDERNNSQALFYLEKYLETKDESINSQTLKVIENYRLISEMKSVEQEAAMQQEKAELIFRQKQIEQASKMKQEFLSAMSHEIRTPLNAVTGIISLLKDRADESEKKLLTSLRFSSKNLLRIINDILYFSKLDANKMHLDKHPAEFKELLSNIRETYIGLAMEKGLDLNVVIDPKISESYELDETKLFQILGNLVSNAIKFTETGGVTITAELIDTEPKTDFIEFRVKDTGIGIPEIEKKKLFDSFYMPRSITTRSDGGTGLGLAIVQKLIELHNSSIAIKSNEGQGSEFYFTLNLQRSVLPMKTDIKLFKKLRNKTAILAEDNEINAMVMRELLRKWGVDLTRVKNGVDAIQIAKHKKVDFILMDIHMPGISGIEATEQIRLFDKEIPILALTAVTIDENIDEFHEAGFNDIIPKPYKVEEFFQKIHNGLKQAKAFN